VSWIAKGGWGKNYRYKKKINQTFAYGHTWLLWRGATSTKQLGKPTHWYSPPWGFPLKAASGERNSKKRGLAGFPLSPRSGYSSFDYLYV